MLDDQLILGQVERKQVTYISVNIDKKIYSVMKAMIDVMIFDPSTFLGIEVRECHIPSMVR